MDKGPVKIGVRIVLCAFWVLLILGGLHVSHYITLFKRPNTLYIATWPLLIDAHYLKSFEKETGITLQISYFERSEELLAKLQATGGQGYDIVFPSDYTVAQLIKADLLKKIDRSKLSFFDDLDSRFLSHYYDPDDAYSIPFFWGVFGLGINKQQYDENFPRSWALIFDEQFSPDHIIMSDNARESVLIAAQYLFGSVEALKDKVAQRQVKELLIKQKKWVDIYTDERVDELLGSGNNLIAVGLSTDISRACRLNPEFIEFIVPQEGSFFIVDTIALPKESNETLAYTFINYLYRAEVMDHHIKKFNMCSTLLTTQCVSDYCPSDEVFAKLNFLTDVIDEDDLNNIWIDLLAN